MEFVNMLNTQKVLLEVNPLLEDGSPDVDVVVSWVSSDETMVPLEIQAGGRSCFCLSPLDSGNAMVEVSAPGYITEQVSVSYAPAPVLRALNLTIHQPVDE